MDNGGVGSFIVVVLVAVGLAIFAVLGQTKISELYALEEEICELCPDKEEKQCAKDEWSLDYVLDHCYSVVRSPKVEAVNGETLRILVLEEKALLCKSRLGRSREHIDRLRNHIDVLMDVCRKEKL